MTSSFSEHQPQRYAIHVRGHLGRTMRSAFPALRAELRTNSTVLTGALPDQAALYGVQAQIEGFGLELLEVRRLPAPGTESSGSDEAGSSGP